MKYDVFKQFEYIIRKPPLKEKPAAASGSHLNVSGTSNCGCTCEIS